MSEDPCHLLRQRRARFLQALIWARINGLLPSAAYDLVMQLHHATHYLVEATETPDANQQMQDDLATIANILRRVPSGHGTRRPQ